MSFICFGFQIYNFSHFVEKGGGGINFYIESENENGLVKTVHHL